MAGICTIAPVNSLSFVRINSLNPSFDNTLYQDQDKIGISKNPYCQKIQKQDVITIQVKTDFTTVTAWMYDINSGAVTSLTPVVDSVYTDFSFWKVPMTFSNNGFFKVFISATLSGYTTVNYVSEMIEIRDSWDGFKIDYYNIDNTGYVDYSTNLAHLLRVWGVMKFSDIGGKEDFYNNFGVEQRVYAENETIYELDIEEIPYYLCRQILYGGKLDVFKINDIDYILKEHSLSQHPSSHNYDLTLKLTQKLVTGINGEFQSDIAYA